MNPREKRILVVGSSSFVATDLPAALRTAGHEVWTFDRRRPPNATGHNSLVGPWTQLAKIAGHAIGRCDVVINCALLKTSDAKANEEYCDELLAVRRVLSARRLIHISSIACFSLRGIVVRADTPLEENFGQRSPYSQIKIAADRRLMHARDVPELVLVRPGFVVGPGLVDPIVGMAKPLPGQKLIGLGGGRVVVPFIDRHVLTQALVRLSAVPLAAGVTPVLLVDANSPTRTDYLTECCRSFSLGRGVTHLPRWMWVLAMAGASIALSVRRRRFTNFVTRFRQNLTERTYDPTASEALLGMSFSQPWREVLQRSQERQDVNYRRLQRFPARHLSSKIERLLFVGMGRIVQQRHLPALQAAGFGGTIEWYDPHVSSAPELPGLKLTRIARLRDSKTRCAVIAVPPAARNTVAAELPATVRRVLCEKPFATSPGHFDNLQTAFEGREVFVMHNYRFKSNVGLFLERIARWNPGRLRTVRLHFDSPSVELDGATWLREETKSRTLLLDYGIHFLDIALMLQNNEAVVESLTVDRNRKGHTERVQATLRSDDCVTELFLRQGARQRSCRLEFVFQNCMHVLRFFPDSALFQCGNRNAADDLRATLAESRGIWRKILERLGGASADDSHRKILTAFLAEGPAPEIDELRLEQLAPFYRTVLPLAERVYTGGPAPVSLS